MTKGNSNQHIAEKVLRFLFEILFHQELKEHPNFNFLFFLALDGVLFHEFLRIVVTFCKKPQNFIFLTLIPQLPDIFSNLILPLGIRCQQPTQSAVKRSSARTLFFLLIFPGHPRWGCKRWEIGVFG